MRKVLSWSIGAVLLMALGAGAFFYLDPMGQGVVLPIGADRTFLYEKSVDFLEDIQFKDFEKASTYHLAATQAKRNIPELIQRVFQVRHEVLDIQRFEILDIDLDRKGGRARVKALVHFHVLGNTDVRESARSKDSVEMIFYWFKQPDGEWAMELESSLR
jgi:hypothetical protein